MSKFVVLTLWYVLFGVIALTALVWSVVKVIDRDFLTTAVVLGFVSCCVGLIAYLSLPMSGVVTPRPEYDHIGTTIRRDSAVDISYLLIVGGAFVSVGTVALFGWSGRIDIALPPGQTWSRYAGVAAMATLALLPVLWMTLRHRGTGFVRLTEAGIEILGRGGLASCTWDEVVDITNTLAGRMSSPREKLYVVKRKGPELSTTADAYTPGGDALRRFVRFYLIYSDYRYELTDGSAVDRFWAENQWIQN
ncbi:putative membrane protein YqjE [Mycobacterium sp. MAA66]|uniref:hypothetical protein n=1 Tax=Mycobacterium sp. MAA66 TaxID=3156297 RepID=UPI0035138D6F